MFDIEHALVHALVILMGLVFLFVALRALLRGMASRGWPTASGTVISSAVDLIDSHDDDDGSVSETYAAKIIYEYRVSGESYSNDRRRFGDVSTSSRRRAERILNCYKQGMSVSVYYDPNNPQLAVLETGVGWKSILLLVIGVVILGFGISLALRY